MPSPGTALRAPLLWLLLPYMGGVAAAAVCPDPPLPAWPLAAAATGLAGFGSWLAQSGRPGISRCSLAVLVAVGAACGAVSFIVRTPPPIRWSAAPREVVVTIKVEQVFPGPPTRKTVSGLARIVSADGPVAEITGRRVYFSAIKKISVPPQRSGLYRVRGVLAAGSTATKPASGFDRYLGSLGINLTVTRARLEAEVRAPGWFARFCTRADRRLETILRHGVERHADVVAIYLGMLLGERAVLSPEQQDAFTRSGTFHIFVIAGLHVGVIALAIQSALQLLRVPRRIAIIPGLGLLWLYVEVTGAGLPARRALVMIAFLQSARVLRRPGNSLAALALAAFATLLWDPQELFNAGFQMSYSVVTALVVMGAPLSRRWAAAFRPWRYLPERDWGRTRRAIAWLGRDLLRALAISWVALLASTPSMIGNFGLLSPGSLVANLAIIPLASLTISAGFTSLLAGLARVLPASSLFNHAAVLLIKGMETLISRGAGLPGVYFPAQFAQPWMAPVAQLLVVAAMLVGASLRWRPAAGGFWLPVLALVLVLFFGVKFG